jgi:sugar lactone lactonase YvrE
MRGETISVISPTNTGGTIPATQYGTTSTLAGSVQGFADGTGVNAQFSKPLGIAVDNLGYVYVPDRFNNRIRKITPSGVVSTIAGNSTSGFVNGTGTAAFFNQPNGVAIDSSGNLYITDTGNYAVRKITPSGEVSTLAGAGTSGYVNGSGNVAKFNVPLGITVDSNNNVYVADRYNYRIRKISPLGEVSTYAGSGATTGINAQGEYASFNEPVGIDINNDGIVYVGEYSNNLVRQIGTQRYVTTLAGCFCGGIDDEEGIMAGFKNPFGVAVGYGGDIFVADYNSNKIRRITPDGNVSTLAGSGVAGKIDGVGGSASFRSPADVAVDNDGNVYVADAGNSLIRKIVATGYSITPNLPNGLYFNSATGQISGTPSEFLNPTIFTVTAYNKDGSSKAEFTLSIPDLNNYSTRVFKQNVEIVQFNPVPNNENIKHYSEVTTLTYMPPTQTAVEGKDDGPISTAKFSQPQGLAKDAAGNIYVTEKTGNRIRKINFSTGQVTTVAGDISAINGLTGQTNANGTAARFWTPTDVVVDSHGNLFVTDMNNHGIRKITPAGNVTLFAGPVVRATGMTDGTGTDARFNQPWGITIDSNDNLYVVDRVNNRIRKITPTAVVTTFAGSVAGAIDGDAITQAKFNNPTGIEIDSHGDFYIADGGGNRLRKITTSTMTVSTIAGSETGGTTDGQGTSATFSLPSGVAIDEYGVAYVSDKGYGAIVGNKIRQVSTGGFVMTLAGSVAGITNDVVGTSAKFRNPSDLLYDQNNRCLYVADCVNHTIRRINLTSYNVAPALPTGLSINMLSGEIFGTPSIVTSATNYTINGFDTIGGNSIISIEVVSTSSTIFTITSTAGANGKITGSKEILSGGSATFTITPNTGYEIDKLKINGTQITSTLNYTFSNVNSNQTIDVTFKISGQQSPGAKDLTSLQLIEEEQDFNIYPNPTKDNKFFIAIPHNNAEYKRIIIRDIVGRIVVNEEYPVVGNLIEINLKFFPYDILFVEVERMGVKKVIVHQNVE